MDLQAYAREHLFILNGADLEYTRKNSWWMMLYGVHSIY